MPTIHELITEGWANSPEYIRQFFIHKVTDESAFLRPYLPAGATIADIGGGWGALCMALAAQGYKPVLVDDYGDSQVSANDHRYKILRRLGVEAQKKDATQEAIFAPNSLDGVTCIAMLEHMHHSPKPWLIKLVEALKPGGVMMIGGPNCSHILKRIRAVLGKTAWTPLNTWWNSPQFRGHVREPNAQDYHTMLQDLGLRNIVLHARNFEGYQAASKLKRLTCQLFDYPLRLRPNLCSDIYALGVKA